jgi:drug/metabolite transporter (DMT)-like permease
MNRIVKLSMLFSIPILISLSWLLGGTLVHKVPPLALSIVRFGVGSFILFLFTDLKLFIKNNSRNYLFKWLGIQFILAVTGRALYAYFSAKSLLTISPFEAILLSTSLPVFLLILERILGKSFQSPWVPLLGLLSFTSVFLSILTYNNAANIGFSGSLTSGHFEMLLAMFVYAIHLIYYKNQVKDISPVNPLFAQFLLAGIILASFNNDGFIAFISFDFSDWVRFLVYAIICNLLPFVLVHYCIKTFSSFTIGAVAILSPLFAFIFSGIYEQKPLDLKFVILSLVACLLTYMTVWIDQFFNHRKKFK